MREFLSERNIPFVERNIRQDPQAKEELLRLTGKLVVPAFVLDGKWFFGYDPERLGSLGARFQVERDTMESPPRDSASPTQGTMAVLLQSDLAATLADLLVRI